MRFGPRPRRAPRGRCSSLVLAALVVALAAGCLASCGGGSVTRDTGRGLTIGFLYVGSTDDKGYNEAAHEGAMAVARAFPSARLIQREHVPETAVAEHVMQDMIDHGASIIFATSFGHLEAALKVAARNPRVTFLHQGGQQTAANLGTYFGTIWQAQYAAGQAAGMATHTNRLGFVAAFPIAQSLLSINAFQLGARSVNPKARTRVEFTGSWCAPNAQRRAARDLLAWRADVLTQHQDCTRAVIEEAARAQAMTTGHHYDAHALAPAAWLTGAIWDWRRLYVDMVRTIREKTFSSSRYAGRYRFGMGSGAVRLASFGAAATPAIRTAVTRTAERLRAGTLTPFHGPIRDRAGRLRISGRQPSVTELEETDYLVEGVSGAFPKA
jgi:basic membrane lipoprotein Med (substrate-binding protein (PBP1-ABC) superfamily)